MSNIKQTAEKFLKACDDGEGWEACKAYCHEGATFEAQAPAIDDIATIEGYTDWLKGLYTFVTDTSYEQKSVAVDEDRQNVTCMAVFHGTHTGEGGPVPATGKRADSDYVYCLHFDGDRIRHMTKVWNDGFALQQLGWA